ncbi:MAG: sigma 54-interacting transcriptional regulator [Desulfomonile tiedjei]|nr:sigma 54-interacting transcriptional regulator [Desulfomonile tiedjei]
MDSRVNQLELKVLYDISQIIGQALNLDQTLEMILGILSEYLSMKRATITLRNGERNVLAIRASHGLRTEEKKRGVYRLDEGVTGLIFRTAEPFVVPDITKEPLFLNKTGSRKIEKGQISFIGVPIVLQGTPLGVLSVDRLFDEDISFEEDIRFLTILAALVAQLVSLNRQVQTREENLIRANLSLKADLSEKSRNFFSVGTSPAMSDAQQLIRKVAPTKATVLLLGESGTGKTLVARIIHELSSRARFSFIKVNCAALPDNLLESELFGYEKGAFTGATDTKVGRVEEADGGSIFLDEIGELSMPLQAKLLRFLQEREFERLGSTKTRQVDVRIIAATNRDLGNAVADGSFREDLYYRLNVFPVRVPPVRERQEDIVPLINFFSEKICREYGCELKFTYSALDAFERYSWPGNVREMENLVERLAIIFMGGTIDVRDLSTYLAYVHREPHAPQPGLLDSLQERERRDVIDALERNNRNQSAAARELGITLRQMGYRVKKFGLEEMLKPRRPPQ